MRSRLVAGLAAAALATMAGTAGVTAANAAPRSSAHAKGVHGHTIGGPLLASKGVIVSPSAGAPPLPPASALPASSWMVTNLTTGQVLAAKDPHGEFLPASTLKTLTALTLIPRLDAHSTFTATYKDAAVDGTRAGLVAGMKYSISKLFACMLVMSANDAADALSQANGSIGKTVQEMNVKARELQADDTHADTPSGLDGPGETTSAYDLTLIAKQDFAMPAFRHYVQILSTNVPAPHHKHFAIQSHNELLTYYHYRGAIGGKNGYTVAAQGTDVNAATRHGQTIVVTLMHAYPNFWPMAADLLDWGFKANGKVNPVGQLVAPLPPHSAKLKAQEALAIGPGRQVTRAGSGASLVAQVHLQLIGEVVLALVVALGIAGTVLRRRAVRRRQRHYRSRLRLPPI